MRKRVEWALKLTSIYDLRERSPHEVSGGQQQRVAIARALVNDPAIILADEPTGNLDEDSADVILNLLKRFHIRGATVIIATHDKELIRKAGGRVIYLQKGRMQTTSIHYRTCSDDYLL